MNQNSKTIAFVVAALAVAGLAFATYPRPNFTLEKLEGTPLFPALAKLNPDSLKSLEVVTFHEDKAALEAFKVEQKDDRWTLPKHQNYPADAKQHMVDAAKALVALQIEKEVTNKPGEHAEYGVVDPDPSKLKPGDTGVGKRISVTDKDGKTAAQFIVGKSPEGMNDFRYVRNADNNQVVLVKVNPDTWSTKFGDWIEKDLLKIDPFSIKQVVLRDYNLEIQDTGDGRMAVTGVNERGEATIDYDDAKSEWKLARYRALDDKGEPLEKPLKDDEELNSATLNDLKTALNDLKIVDVERKPVGLDGTLEEFLGKGGARSLAQHGFVPYKTQSGKLDVLSNDGEIIVRQKTGVEYVLRFGSVAGTSDEPDAKQPAKKDGDKKADGDDAKTTSVNRYIFVMAQLNESLIPKPELEPLPTDEPEKKPADEKPKDGDQPKATEPPKDLPKDDGPANAKKADEKSSRVVREPATTFTAVADEEKAADKPADKADKKADDKPTDKGAEPTDEPKVDVPPAPKKEDPAVAKARIEAENKHKELEYQEKIKKAQDKVKELNKRFGEWYYVVSDSEYKKIHLGRNDIVRKKEKPKGEGAGADDFNELQKGIDKKPEQPKPNTLPDAPQP